MHEAGHAVLCRLAGVKIASVTVEWSGTSHGALVYAGKPQAENLLLILLAGEIAVAHADRLGWFEQPEAEPRPATREHQPHVVQVTSDAENVQALLAQMHTDDPDARDRALEAARIQVEEAVERHWAQIGRVAEALLRETTLRGRAVSRIIDRAS